MDLSRLLLEENVGGWDLFFRAALGSASIVVLALGYLMEPWSYVAGIVAFVGLFSGIMRHCTPYVLFGISTRRK
jgi:hypothetical protein